jgi:potassium-dependent mechanosensitive channel
MKRHLIQLAASLLFLTAGALHGQDSLSGDFSKPAEISKRLEDARADIAKLPAEADPVLRERLEQFAAACQFHLASLDVRARARAERDKAASDKSAWNGLTDPPPHSILQLDEVRESLATLEGSRRAGEAQLRIFSSQLEGLRDRLDTHQQAERRAREDAESAATPEARAAAERTVEMERIASRITAEEIGRQNIRMEAQQAELDLVASRTDIAQLRLGALQGKTTFTRQDLDAIQAKITRDRADAIAALTASGRNSQTPDPLLAWRTEFLDLEKEFWETRFAATTAKGEDRKAAITSLNGFKTRVDDWAEIAQLRLAGGNSAATGMDPERLRQATAEVGVMQRRIGFALADLEAGHFQIPLLDTITGRLHALWDAELYLAEETEVIDGKKISTYRAVTLGKLARLALILTVGWLLLRFLSRRIKALLARKSKISPDTADLAGKWIFGLGLALLVVYGLNTVRIPFTIFAFLGGALAIGVGFGTQTMLKNFISGLILIFERPFKVGDQVEVDGVLGKIRSIGLRASVIDHGNGIDTLIPNSNLLENQVTNWTFTNSLLRHSVLVAVDHGSSTREVAHCLLAVAAEHGLVLDSPEPEVRFEEMSDKALLFRLIYWFDLKRVARDSLSSDLRFMISKSLAEAGITLAGVNPLRVELATPPAPESFPSAIQDTPSPPTP